MDRKDALEFLELPEFATPEEIKVRLEDRLAYFENLSEKAPSEFVRRLHARNVAKVREIMQVAASWPAAAPPAEVTEPGADEEVAEAIAETPVADQVAEPIAADRIPETAAADGAEEPVRHMETPAIGADLVPSTGEMEEARVSQTAETSTPSAAGPLTPPAAELLTPAAEPLTPPVAEPLTPPAAEPLTPPAADPKEPLGWLIRHTENQTPVTFPLMEGANFIGRKSKPGLTPFIAVTEDPYISKVHAVIFAGPDGFFLADNASSNGSKASTNGTYLNGKDDRISTKVRLKNRDTIQIGITKLILRYNDNQLSSLVDEVAGQDYMHTVVINI